MAKIRHEQLCRDASRPVASALRSRGFTVVRHLLPSSKLEYLLHEVGVGNGETLAALSLARELKFSSEGSPGGVGTDSKSGHIFSPLPSFTRRGLTGAPGDTASGKQRGIESDGGAGGSCMIDLDDHPARENTARACGRGRGGVENPGALAISTVSPKRTRPRKICLEGLGLESGDAAKGTGGRGWDPKEYTSRPEEWMKPPVTVVKRRWDHEAKVHGRCSPCRLGRVGARLMTALFVASAAHNFQLRACKNRHMVRKATTVFE